MTMLSRVADTLYWMSRYLERAEHTARLLDLHLHLMLDQSAADPQARWDRLFASLHLSQPPADVHESYAITRWLTLDIYNDSSILACISAARENARHVREQISSEMWEHINRLYFEIKRHDLTPVWYDQPHELYRAVKEGVHLFQGITDSTMSNGEGWNFIQVGRYVERASTLAQLIDTHFQHFANIPLNQTITDDFLEWVSLLKCCTAYEAYCKVYTAEIRPDRIAEYLIFNSDFPHTIRFSVDWIYQGLQSIANITESKRAKHVNRLAGKLHALLDYSSVDEILAAGLHEYLEAVQTQCGQIHNAIYSAYIIYPADDFI